MEHCQKKPENSAESNTEETKKSDLTQDYFHLEILKDISCEFLSNIFQALTKVRKSINGFFSKRKYELLNVPIFIITVNVFGKMEKEKTCHHTLIVLNQQLMWFGIFLYMYMFFIYL